MCLWLHPWKIDPVRSTLFLFLPLTEKKTFFCVMRTCIWCLRSKLNKSKHTYSNPKAKGDRLISDTIYIYVILWFHYEISINKILRNDLCEPSSHVRFQQKSIFIFNFSCKSFFLNDNQFKKSILRDNRFWKSIKIVDFKIEFYWKSTLIENRSW